MKLPEQTRRAWQGTRLRDKGLPSHCQPAGVIYLRRINTSPTTPNPRDSSQEHSQLLPEPACSWACPTPLCLLTNTVLANVPWAGPCAPAPGATPASALCRGSRRSGMELEHPALTEGSRHQAGKPVPWGGLRKDHDGGLAAAQSRDWLQVHTQALGSLLALQGSPDLLTPVCVAGSSTTSAQHTARQGKEVFHMRPGSPGGPAG